MLDNRLLQHFTANDIKQSDKLLSIAICNNNIDSIKWLLDNGVSPNAKDEDGDTVLQLAVWNDESGQIARLLIEKGADVNAQNTDGCTALQSAIPIHDISIVKLLLEQGADVNIKDNHNSSALDKIFVRCYINDNEIIASDNIRLETLKLLIDHGAEITSKEINQAMWHKFQQEISTSKALLLMLGSAQNIKIDLTDYGIHQFFTSEDNIKALFAVDGYESQKAIAKENIFKSLQEYGEIHNNPKALDIAQLVAEQGVDLPNAEITEDLELPDHLDHKAELAGDIQDNNPDVADAA